MVKWLQQFVDWVDQRFPLMKLWNEHLAQYYAPKNFNFWYFFGSLALLVLVNQIITGVFLTMHYTPSSFEAAFASVEYIMREVSGGWLIRYMHSTGASAFFVVIYLHMFRGLLYGSYKEPRELIWIFGMLIYLVLMGEAFMGYLLPGGQMSYWGAQVILNLFSAIPFVGEDISIWIRGDYVISGATLNRFFALHVIAMPLVLLGLVVAHLMALHEVGSNNPDGIEIKQNKDSQGIPKDGIPFHPYYTVKDIFGAVVFLFVCAVIVFYMPEFFGRFLEHPNFEVANPFKTPDHIAPVWYFTPFYSVLRAIPSFWGTQIWGVIGMGASIVCLFFLPWLDRSSVKSIRYKGMGYKLALAVFVLGFMILGYLGMETATAEKTLLAQVFSVLYFYFFLYMPFYTRETLSQDLLSKSVVMSAFVVNALLVVYWLSDPHLFIVYKILAGAAIVLYWAVFAFKPVFIKVDPVKPVPARVTG